MEEKYQGMILVTELAGSATSVRLLKPSDMVDFSKSRMSLQEWLILLFYLGR